MAVGTCKHCGHRPVGADAPVCPNCGGPEPNPSTSTKVSLAFNAIIVGIMVLGLLLGVVLFAVNMMGR